MPTAALLKCRINTEEEKRMKYNNLNFYCNEKSWYTFSTTPTNFCRVPILTNTSSSTLLGHLSLRCTKVE